MQIVMLDIVRQKLMKMTNKAESLLMELII